MSRSRAAFLALSVLASLFAAGRADAIPAFARKYQISCSTCHAPFPRLKPFGEEFAAAGFRMPDPAKEPARATVETGDPLLQLPRDFPLAARLEGHAAWKEDAAAEADFEWPYAFKLLMGGPLGKKISYYVYYILEQGESGKLEDAWVQFNGLFGAPLDLQVGQFQVCDPMFKRELRLERFDYEILKTRVGFSPTNLTYDRGLLLAWHAPAKIDVVATVVNGNGIEEADEEGNFDEESFKNTSLRLVRPFGPVRVGLFGYYGTNASDEGIRNSLWYAGPDIVWDIAKEWQFSAQYLERQDSNPYFAEASPEFETRGGFAELHFFPAGQDGRWALSALYNTVDSDDEAAIYESASITMNYLIARNVRLLVEAGRDLEADANTASIGLVTAW